MNDEPFRAERLYYISLSIAKSMYEQFVKISCIDWITVKVFAQNGIDGVIMLKYNLLWKGISARIAFDISFSEDIVRILKE